MNGNMGLSRTLLEVEIDAPAARVWQSLTGEISSWWPDSFNVGGPGATFCLELRPGGRMYEDWGNDHGLLWATVVQVAPGKVLGVAGDMFPQYGGPGRWLATWTLTERDGKTTVRFEDARFGAKSAEHDASMDEGWKILLDALVDHTT